MSEKFNSVIDPSLRFTPADVVEHLGSRHIKVVRTFAAALEPSNLLWGVPFIVIAVDMCQVGMVLDLTNTSRYYDPQEWEEMGIRHRKVNSCCELVPLPAKSLVVLRFCNSAEYDELCPFL